jgi:hypothetical protein
MGPDNVANVPVKIAHEVKVVGKMLKSTKRRAYWKFAVEGQGLEEFEVVITHSLLTGRKRVEVYVQGSRAPIYQHLDKRGVEHMIEVDHAAGKKRCVWDHDFKILEHECKVEIEDHHTYILIVDGYAYDDFATSSGEGKRSGSIPGSASKLDSTPPSTPVRPTRDEKNVAEELFTPMSLEDQEKIAEEEYREMIAKKASPDDVTPSKLMYEKVHRNDKVYAAESPSEIQVGTCCPYLTSTSTDVSVADAADVSEKASPRVRAVRKKEKWHRQHG